MILDAIQSPSRQVSPILVVRGLEAEVDSDAICIAYHVLVRDEGRHFSVPSERERKDEASTDGYLSTWQE